jgi:hypothetical protein
MAPPAQIPAVAPDGTSGYVDASALQQAVNAGYKPGLTMRAPDGTKGIVAFTDMAQARGSGYKTEGEYQQSQQPPSEAPQGFLQSLVAPIPQAARSLYHAVADPATPQESQAITSLGGTPDVVGRAMYRTLIQPTIAHGKQALADIQSPNLSDKLASVSDAASAIPVLGGVVSAGTGALQQYLNGDKSGATGTVLGNLLAAGLGAGATSKISEAIRPSLPSPVTNPEIQARTISSAVNPPSGMQNFIDAVQAHGGDVTDYAKQNGIGIGGVLDYSKAAKGAADQTLQQYMGLLDPNKAITVPVSDAYQGNLARTPGQGAGRYANLGDINSRIGDINDLLRPAFNTKTEGASMTAQERLGLGQEHAELTDKLHQSLGAATDIPPEAIADLRGKFGKLYTIADQANAAVNARQGLESNMDQGTRTVPLTATSFAVEKLNQILRGGPMKIADASLRGALRNSTLPATQPIPPQVP